MEMSSTMYEMKHAMKAIKYEIVYQWKLENNLLVM